MRHRDGGDAIDGSLLDRSARHLVRAWDQSIPGECAGHQEHAGTQDGHTGMPVAVEAARVWPAEKFVPAGGRNLRNADLVATAPATHRRWGALYSAHAEGAHTDEPALLSSDSYLGAQYRRLRAKLDAPKAIKAMANKLARIVYRMLKYGQQYLDKGQEVYQQKFRQQQIQVLTKKAASLGLQLIQSA